MNHPTKEDWMSYLYAELPPEKYSACAAHLRECAGCRYSVETWQTALLDLDGYEIAPFPKRNAVPMPTFKWALAAVVLLGLGLALGRISTPNPQAAVAAALPALRQQLQNEMRSDLVAAVGGAPATLTNDFRRGLRAGLEQREAGLLLTARNESEQVAAQLGEALQSVQARDHQNLVGVVSRLELQRRDELARLRRDLETVAVVAEDRLDRTQTQLGDLANISLASAGTSHP